MIVGQIKSLLGINLNHLFLVALVGRSTIDGETESFV